MKKLKDTAKIAESDLSCPHCSRKFVRESAVYKHICEQKRRWDERDRPSNRIGYNSWLQFYSRNVTSKRLKYEDFMKSTYYLAFVRYGIYCVDVGVLNPSRYLDWLLKNKIKIDTWSSDTVYTKYLCEYLREEDPYDALSRSVQTTDTLSEAEELQCRDVLRWGNTNRVCHALTTGKISPWMLYHSESGVQFLNKLDETQVKLVFDYINPELWALTFKRKSEHVSEIKQLLKQAGY